MAMQIVALDAYAVNPGDLDWGDLKALGDCVFYDRTTREELLERAQGAPVLLTNKVPLRQEQIEALPALRYIGVTATGYNTIDLEAAKARGVVVTNVPAYSTPSVAQAVMALLLELTNHTGHYAARVREGAWCASMDFHYMETGRSTVELAGLTMGIVGFGAIGGAVAALAQALGMKVIATVRTPRVLPPGVEACSLEELLARADVVSLHCPLTDATRNLIDAPRLARMKPTAYLINTSRGPLIDESALAAALESGHLAGAGLDVLSAEPPKADNPLLRAPRCVITPHLAWATRAARGRLVAQVVANLKAWMEGAPVNVVNG